LFIIVSWLVTISLRWRIH